MPAFPFIRLKSRPPLRLRASAVFICLLAACGRHAENGTNSVFRINLSSGSLESLDPAYAKDLYTNWTVHALYNTLVETDENLRLQPSVATRWEASPDGLTYIFHLRADVRFHDNPAFPKGEGRRLTAADWVYSFNRIIDPAVASSGAWIFNDRVAEKDPFLAPDDSTLIIRLRAPFGALPSLLSMPYCSAVPREVAEKWGKDFRRHPCGTGPFRFAAWEEGAALTLHRNAHYWERDDAGNALPYLPAVQYSFYDSKATEFLLFLQGKLDFVNGIDGSFKDLVLAKNGTVKPEFAQKFRLQKSRYLNTEYLGFLVDDSAALLRASPTRHRLVRQAICYAIDREKIRTYFRNGVGIPATSGFIPEGLPGADTTGAFGYDYDPRRSLELLAQAGFPNGRGLQPITIQVPDNWADIVNYIVGQLADVGIPARTEIMQPNILRQQMSEGKALCFRAQWIADYPDAETYLAFFNSRLPAPPNYTRFSNKEFDRLYDEAARLPDTARWVLYRKMDSLAVREAPVVPLFYDELMHFTQRRVRGFSANPMNLLELKRVRVQ